MARRGLIGRGYRGYHGICELEERPGAGVSWLGRAWVCWLEEEGAACSGRGRGVGQEARGEEPGVLVERHLGESVGWGGR